MKSFIKPKNKVIVVLAMLLGFVMLGLTSYYLYAGYVFEKDSSAGSCKAQAYECTCKNGTKQKINYNYCQRTLKGYEQCMKLDLENETDKSKKKELEKDKAEFWTTRYENVRKNVNVKDGTDNVLNAKECFDAGWCKSEKVLADGTFDWKNNGQNTMYQRYVEFMKKYQEQTKKYEENIAKREANMRENTCSQIKSAYERNLDKDRELRCQKACVNTNKNIENKQKGGSAD